jgi:hypothetical protein
VVERSDGEEEIAFAYVVEAAYLSDDRWELETFVARHLDTYLAALDARSERGEQT